MRLHRKKYLDQRMDAVGDMIVVRYDGNHKDARDTQCATKLDLARIFGNDNPVALEFGCGKGQWVCRMAQRYPDINFLAVENMSNVIIVGAERAKRQGLANVRFANCGAEYMPRYLADDCCDYVYLNFSYPLPRSTYEKRRLTYKRYLDLYRGWLRDGGVVRQKTDNRPFFEYSLCSMNNYGMVFDRVSLDLHADADIDNVTSEYEDKFAPLGPIYYIQSHFAPRE